MAMKKLFRKLALYGDHVCPFNSPDMIIAKIEQMPGFVDKTIEAKGRKQTAKMLIAAYNHVFCKTPLPKSIQKLI